MAAVFVSYARQDIDWVASLAGALETHGVALWWDRRLLAGQSFEALIDARLADAPAVLVVWSKASIASDWVKDEAAEGRTRGRLVPVSIDGSRPPFGFRQVHTLDLRAWDGKADAAEIGELVEALRAAGAPAGQTEAPGEPSRSAPPPETSSSSSARPPGGSGDDETTWFVPRDLRTGEEIAQFRIVRKLGQGGFGAAYEAVNVHNERERVALKVLLPDMAARETFADILKSEADALQRVKHDAVVQYRTFGRLRASDEYFLAVEYIEGPTLAEWRRTHSPSMAEILALAARLKSGLDAVHAQGVVHRDLSPDNIILPGGRLDKATIIDFGIARHGTIDMLSGGFAGKLSWTSPEQLDPGLGEVGPWSDFYSLGLILAFLARGAKLPIGGSIEAARNARQGVPKLDGIRPDLAALIAGLLQPDPASRRADLSDEISAPGWRAPDDPPGSDAPAPLAASGPARAEPVRYRGPVFATIAALALVAGVAAVIVMLSRGGSEPAAEAVAAPPPVETAAADGADEAVEPEPTPEPTPASTPAPTPEPDSPALLQLPEDVRPAVRRAEQVATAARAIEDKALRGSAEAFEAYAEGNKRADDGERAGGLGHEIFYKHQKKCLNENIAEGGVFCRYSDDKRIVWAGEGSCGEAGCTIDGSGYHAINVYPYWQGTWRNGVLVSGALWEVGEIGFEDGDNRPPTSWHGDFNDLQPHGYGVRRVGEWLWTGRVEQSVLLIGCAQDGSQRWATDIIDELKRTQWICADFANGGYGSHQQTELRGDHTSAYGWSKSFFKQNPNSDFLLARFEESKPVGPVVIYRRDGSRVETATNADGSGLGSIIFADGSRYVGQINGYYYDAEGLGALYDKSGALKRAGKWKSGKAAD